MTDKTRIERLSVRRLDVLVAGINSNDQRIHKQFILPLNIFPERQIASRCKCKLCILAVDIPVCIKLNADTGHSLPGHLDVFAANLGLAR